MTDEIHNVLTLSTSHVTETTAKILNSIPCEQWSSVCGGPFGSYGWFMYAPEEDFEGTIPPELMRVFKYARSVGCKYVLFDRDANTVDQLPAFEW